MLMIYFLVWKKCKRLYKRCQLVMSRVLDYNIVTRLEKAQLYMRRFLFNEQTTADEKEI